VREQHNRVGAIPASLNRAVGVVSRLFFVSFQTRRSVVQISLSEEQIQSAIDSSVATAIQNAIGGYSVQSAIGQKITNEVIDGAIGTALHEALKTLDVSALAKSLSEQIQRTTTAAVCRLVRESMVEMILKLRGKTEYSSGYKEEREKLSIELANSI
jgi:regulator of protease activity HflC (stomatin/prohibitin superfamily)